MKLLNLIEKGSFGELYACETDDGSKVAVKRNLVEKKSTFSQSLKELDILTKIKGHESFVQLIEMKYGDILTEGEFEPIEDENSREDGIKFVLELADCDLWDYIHTYKDYDYEREKGFSRDILKGLQYMHDKNIIYRDMKPGNILICGNKAKICDFGMALVRANPPFDTCVGSSHYRSPEIALGYTTYTRTIDIWSYGCVLYELFFRKQFIRDSEDEDDLITEILRCIPNRITNKQLDEFVINNSYREVNLTKTVKGSRRGIAHRSKLTKEEIEEFDETPGTFAELCDLITRTLAFDGKQRPTAEECLDSRFFGGTENPRSDLYVMAMKLYENYDDIDWCSPSVIFSTVKMYKRYTKHNDGKYPNADCQTIFDICSHIAAKYHHNLSEIYTFDYMTDNKYIDILDTIEELELYIIVDVFKGLIYKPTVYDTTLGDTTDLLIQQIGEA